MFRIPAISQFELVKNKFQQISEAVSANSNLKLDSKK